MTRRVLIDFLPGTQLLPGIAPAVHGLEWPTLLDALISALAVGELVPRTHDERQAAGVLRQRLHAGGFLGGAGASSLAGGSATGLPGQGRAPQAPAATTAAPRAAIQP